MSFGLFLDAAELSSIIRRAESTILRDVSRNPKSLPPFFNVGKKKIWSALVVEKWLRENSSEPIDADLRLITSATVKAVQPSMPSLADMLGAASSKGVAR